MSFMCVSVTELTKKRKVCEPVIRFSPKQSRCPSWLMILWLNCWTFNGPTGQRSKDRPGAFVNLLPSWLADDLTNLSGDQLQLAGPEIKSPLLKNLQCAFIPNLSVWTERQWQGLIRSSCDYLWRHPSRYLLSCVVRPKMCRHWRRTNGGKIVNGPDGHGINFALSWQFIQASDDYRLLLK